jgi:hypothetical protein
MLSNEQITKFQALYKNRFGEEISHEEAYEKGARLIRLIKLAYEPITEKSSSVVQEQKKEATILLK